MQIELLEMVQQLWLWLWLLNWLSFIPLLVVCWDMNFTLLNGTYYSDKTTALEYIFQLPTLPQPWPGVVFVAHGCGDTAGSFWPKSKTCEECCGLPLGTLLTLRGLQNNFAIIATTARNRCFKSEDFSSLVRILQSFYLQYNISSQIPVHLLGFCKGGQGLGLFLQNQTNLQQLSPIRIASLAVTLSALKFTSAITSMRPFPIPTLLIPMKKDGGVMWEIQKTVPLIRSLEVSPARDWPLTTDCFYTYSRGYFNKSESLAIYHILKENGFLNETNYLRKDPLSYHDRWQQVRYCVLFCFVIFFLSYYSFFFCFFSFL